MNRLTLTSSVVTTTFLCLASACVLDESIDEIEFRDDTLDDTLGYEVWASDQSNSVPGETRRGVNGGFIWIWDSAGIEAQIAGGPVAAPLACAGMNAAEGPCDVNEVFPASLVEYDADGEPTGATRPQIGRLHGMLVDPQNKYLTANLFAPNGGFIGIIDGRSKQAIALFRASATSAGRSNHMSFWDNDGSSIIISNLDGKILERIDVIRDEQGDIIEAIFVEGAGLGVSRDMAIRDRPKVYLGDNLAGQPLIGTVDPGQPDLDDLTPNGACRENGCAAGPNGSLGGRPNNLIVCPIPSRTTTHAYLTLAGGGLLVVDHSTTPMSIVGEYGGNVINGAGCGGVETKGSMFLNAGVSASAAGANQSTFTLYRLPLEFPTAPDFAPQNSPAPTLVYTDSTNTATNGLLDGPAHNLTGQLPGVTTRRDSHGMVRTRNQVFVHTVDRLQNLVEVVRAIGAKSYVGSYDLTSADGRGNGVGACEAFSVDDDPGLPTNDPTPDLFDAEPNGRYLFVGLRGPVPVSVIHASQGSCPGVGVIELDNGGRHGRMITVLPSTNTIDTVELGAASSAGGHTYVGAERSDVHAAIVRRTVEDE